MAPRHQVLHIRANEPGWRAFEPRAANPAPALALDLVRSYLLAALAGQPARLGRAGGAKRTRAGPISTSNGGVDGAPAVADDGLAAGLPPEAVPADAVLRGRPRRVEGGRDRVAASRPGA